MCKCTAIMVGMFGHFLFNVSCLIQDELIISGSNDPDLVVHLITFYFVLNVHIKYFDDSRFYIAFELNAKIISMSVLNVDTIIVLIWTHDIKTLFVWIWIFLNIQHLFVFQWPQVALFFVILMTFYHKCLTFIHKKYEFTIIW